MNKSSKKNTRNRRPTLTPADLQDFKFMLGSMRDDRNRLRAAGADNWENWEPAFERAEELAKRILGDDYTPGYR